jgi:hypothetical protein
MAGHPVPSFEHLLRLSDDTGLLEHARGVDRIRRRLAGDKPFEELVAFDPVSV